jgi:hypothetical protein
MSDCQGSPTYVVIGSELGNNYLNDWHKGCLLSLHESRG